MLQELAQSPDEEFWEATMLTRRSLLAGVGGLYVAARASRLLAAATGLKTSVAFDVPHGACDTHVHVIGDPAEFPMSPERE